MHRKKLVSFDAGTSSASANVRTLGALAIALFVSACGSASAPTTVTTPPTTSGLSATAEAADPGNTETQRESVTDGQQDTAASPAPDAEFVEVAQINTSIETDDGFALEATLSFGEPITDPAKIQEYNELGGTWCGSMVVQGGADYAIVPLLLVVTDKSPSGFSWPRDLSVFGPTGSYSVWEPSTVWSDTKGVFDTGGTCSPATDAAIHGSGTARGIAIAKITHPTPRNPKESFTFAKGFAKHSAVPASMTCTSNMKPGAHSAFVGLTSSDDDCLVTTKG